MGAAYGTIYSRAELVLSQRDMRLIDYDSVADAVADPACPVTDPSDTAVLLAKRGEMYDLNLVAAHVWESLDGRRSVLEIAASVCSAFEVDFEEACRDALRVLDELEAIGLVQAATAEPRGEAVASGPSGQGR